MGSLMMSNYYPETAEGRAEWWENVLKDGASLLAKLGLSEERVASIMADAAWGVYTYGALRETVERHASEITAYANMVASGVEGCSDQPLPAPPKPPAWPAPPKVKITCDFERRRIEWVQEVKARRGYDHDIGAALGIEPLPAVFNSGTYKPDLHELACSEPKTVSGKFRKAHGNIEGVVLRGRRRGSASWTELGRFKATPFSAPVPVAGVEPEEWEFQARAIKRDIETGIPSDIVETVVKG